MIGPGDLDWPDLVRTATRIVAGWARDGQYHFYVDLSREVNAELPEAELEPHGGIMNRLLYSVVMTGREFMPDGPMLSAVVVLKDANNRQPGPGFWDLAKELGRYGGSRDEADRAGFWGQEFAACTQAWTRSTYRDFERWLRTNPVVE
jgi:hypothetical protein